MRPWRTRWSRRRSKNLAASVGGREHVTEANLRPVDAVSCSAQPTLERRHGRRLRRLVIVERSRVHHVPGRRTEAEYVPCSHIEKVAGRIAN